ncbi:MAG TPA: ABC transporter substrate-binding protein, partial [Urbifossiella sp.]
VEARNDLIRAEALDPTIPGLRELKRSMGGTDAVFYVGVRELPEFMSPARARYDSEKFAVQLLFEGLLEEVPDGSGGVRYRTGAALTFPTMIPGGRELFLRQTPRSATGTDGFDAQDVVETIKMFRTRPELPVSAGLPWLDGLPTPTGGGSLRIGFIHGHPDPRALLTFKVLPGRYLSEKGKKLDDVEFATRPFGTGPYRVHSLPDISSTGPREVVFVANPDYARSKDRSNPAQPRISEIRFVEAAKLVDPLDDFRRGNLHLLPDLSPAELKLALDQGGAALGGKGKVVTAATNRRVHILAVNHRRQALQNLDLRKGLALAIDRDEILRQVYGDVPPQFKRFTAAMSGPYPPLSWATVKAHNGLPVPLVNRPNAAVRLKSYLDIPGVSTELRLAYSTEDPQAKVFCEKIKEHVEGLFKNDPDGKKLTLILEPAGPKDLHRLVFDEHRYDLAYVPIDYPDDWHPYGLQSILDRAAGGQSGRNFTGFNAPGTNSQVEDFDLGNELDALLKHRDFETEIVVRAARIHKLFNDRVPFIPLWQLDRHMLVSNGLKVFVDNSDEPSQIQILNPSVLFQNVGRWRLE